MKKIAATIILALAVIGVKAQLLYKISGNGLKASSYIVGTYHLAEATFVDSIPGIRQALDDCQQVVGELDMANMREEEMLKRVQQAMTLPEGMTLSKLLSADEMNRLNAYMKGLMGMDMSNPLLAQQLGSLTPSALSTQFSILSCIKHRGMLDMQNLFDEYFQRYARERGKAVSGLETIDFQIKTLYMGQTLERQKELLMCQVDNAAFFDDMTSQIVDAFYRQDLKALEEAMDQKLNSSCDSSPEEDAKLVSDRNADWLTKMPALMAGRSTFFAVGAGHLTGDDGVLALLRKAGYSVEAVKGDVSSASVSSPSFDEVLATRRSVRSYDASKKISEAEVRSLLKAVQEAPSWANRQPTKYYVAISDEQVAAVQNMVGGNKDRIKQAPVLIVSTFERGKSGFFQGKPTNEVGDGWGAYDNGLSNCYLILKARAMGFDTLIMGMRDADALRRHFNIPDNEAVMAVIALGYRGKEPTQPDHRPLDEVVKFF